MSDDLDPALAAAAAEIVDSIHALRAEASPKIATILGYIEEHLFDRRLSVGQIKRACRIRDNSVAIHFHSAIGVTPGIFITDCRIRVAQSLLATPLPVWRIAELIGYSSIQVFSRAFFRRTGLRPSAYRRLQVKASEPLPEVVPTEFPPSVLLFRAWRGQLPDQEAAKVIEHLVALYPAWRKTP